MPGASFGERAERVMKLLIGLGHAPGAAELMRRYGLGEDDRREGWQRLSAVAAARRPRAGTRPGERLLERLDAWQNVWFPVAGTHLQGRFPAVHAWLFRSLPQSDATTPVASVGLFVQRLLRMPFEPALGGQGAEARELLARRGIDAQTVRIASDLLELISTTPPAGSTQMRGGADDPAAEDALWSWYQHWSEVARVAISDRELLRELGFGGS
jgi:hypothetical protein